MNDNWTVEEELTIRATVNKIRFRNEEGTFSVCELVSKDGDPFTAVGAFFDVREGETLDVTGVWQKHDKFGRQFAVAASQPHVPTTADGIETYLASGLIENIGPVLAKRIVKHFGENTFQVLDDQPNRIREVPGIGKVRGEKIADAWSTQRSIRNVMLFLQSIGISPTFAARIFKKWGANAVRIIQDNPYKMAEEFRGIGFRTADKIAAELGLTDDHPGRLRAAMLFALREAIFSGHTYLPEDILITATNGLLGDEYDLAPALTELIDSSAVIYDDMAELATGVPGIFTPPLYRAETTAAKRLGRLASTPRRFELRAIEHHLERVEADLGFELAPAQQRAVRSAWMHKLAVITGGPGTGKTTIVRAVVAIGDALSLRIALCAPTGRAAKRLTESTGKNALTIHRLLGFSFKEEGFQLNEKNPLDIDMLIVDEASMLDTSLLAAVVAALPRRASLLLVGDIDQLPSVGPGNVLGDIIASGAADVVRLTDIYRQAERSNIVVNAHRINEGRAPIVAAGDSLSDFYSIQTADAQEAQEKIIDLVTSRIPNAFGFDPIHEVQVIAPMHKGRAGCETLNSMLQDALTKSDREFKRAGRLWRIGDKVMQTRNNYDLEIFNGDIGRIVEINRRTEHIGVMFDRKLVSIPFGSLDALTHAYAITVHKSQGSEYRAVVIPVLTEHFVMLQRNLLYTAVTRARDLVILVGQKRALEMAVKNSDAMQRFSLLKERLMVCADEEE